MSNTSQITAKDPMAKAFATVRGAIKRGNAIELRCKRIWLERVIRDLPGTIYADVAQDGLRLVNEKLPA
jgi:hypothetical protein